MFVAKKEKGTPPKKVLSLTQKYFFKFLFSFFRRLPGPPAGPAPDQRRLLQGRLDLALRGHRGGRGPGELNLLNTNISQHIFIFINICFFKGQARVPPPGRHRASLERYR